MILIYRILTTIIYPLLIIIIYFRRILKKEDSKRFKEKILISHFKIYRNHDLKLLWFHAASLGEIKSVVPIIKELNDKNKNLEFLITTTTISSSNLVKTEFETFKNIYHRFFPLDVNFLIDRFLKLWKPNAVFIVDSEIWPNLLFKINKYKIPLALINARITAKTFKRWMWFPKTAKKIFNVFNLCLTSNLETKNYLIKLNVKNTFFLGNIKLSNELSVEKIENINKKKLLEKRFWVAASTHKGEDIFCLKTHLMIKEKYKDIITIIVPRHIDRAFKIKTYFETYKLNTQILDKNDQILDNKEIIIINSFGNLHSYFKYAKSVFIGKSTLKKLENVGGQNPIDAAKLGCKIYHGPYVYNFEEIYNILGKIGISKKIYGYQELSKYLINDFDLSSKKNVNIPESINKLGQKTLTDTMQKINKFLFNEIK
jgi:3-deoxy-D-manno-octulosonic-acid transferase